MLQHVSDHKGFTIRVLYTVLVPLYTVQYTHAPQVNMLPYSGVPRRGGLGCSNPPPRNSEGPPKSCQTQPDCENLKTAEFRTPTPQDVRKKDSKILKPPRFAIVLHQQ